MSNDLPPCPPTAAETAARTQDIQWLTDEQQHLWRTMLSYHTTLTRVIGRQLSEDHNLSDPDFSVLVMLSEAEGYCMRTAALASKLQWERSRLSHQVTRMEKRGLVKREGDPSDGRACLVGLTDKGLHYIKEAAPGHVAAVRANVFAPLSDEDLTDMTRIYEKLLRNLYDLNHSVPDLT